MAHGATEICNFPPGKLMGTPVPKITPGIALHVGRKHFLKTFDQSVSEEGTGTLIATYC